MVFGFTHTRGSNYTPGDSLGPVNELLETKYGSSGIALTARTVYCFDSESFRFLAAQKSGWLLDDIGDFRRSWGQSLTEMWRLIENFRALTPHLIRSTLSLNRARDIILHLTRCMADIIQVIETTINMNSGNVSQLNDVKLKGAELQNRLHFVKSELVTRRLDKPRTVCNDVACKESRGSGNGVATTIYKSICHGGCYDTGFSPEKSSSRGLMKCKAFNGKELCQLCGHHLANHLHVLYETQPVLKNVRDLSVVELLQKKTSEMQLKVAAIKNLEMKIAEASYEYKELQNAAVRFGVFLKQNSITPYNDAMLDYLDQLIKDETHKVGMIGGGHHRLDSLKRNRREHMDEVAVLSKAMADGSADGLMDGVGVEELVEHLYQLKHWGKNLQVLKDRAEAARLNSYHERPYRPRNSGNAWDINLSSNGTLKSLHRAVKGITLEPAAPRRKPVFDQIDIEHDKDRALEKASKIMTTPETVILTDALPKDSSWAQ